MHLPQDLPHAHVRGVRVLVRALAGVAAGRDQLQVDLVTPLVLATDAAVELVPE